MKPTTVMIIGMLGLISGMLSGCLTNKSFVAPCGVTDYIETPKGAVVQRVPLPTDEGKDYNIVTPKNGFWMSFDCHNRMEKGR